MKSIEWDEPVNPVNASCPISTRVAVAFVDINLAVGPRGSWFADALIAVNQVLTTAPELAGVRFAFVDLSLT